MESPPLNVLIRCPQCDRSHWREVSRLACVPAGFYARLCPVCVCGFETEAETRHDREETP